MEMRTVALGTVASLMMASSACAERGTDGQVKILFWQAVSTLNPYLTSGSKDIYAASLVIEPLGRYDETGTPVPWLAASIPTVENGGVSDDLRTITWTLKEGLLWSDGSPVTAQDVAFTAGYCMNPEVGCQQASKFDHVDAVEALDDLTVKISFSRPMPNPYGPFMGAETPVLQAAQFGPCTGTAATTCASQNAAPIGTGPFVVSDFRPNDVVVFDANDHYRDPAKPAFASVMLKGGGDAVASARAVLETGEFDYGWNLQLPPDVLAPMADSGKGRIVAAFGTLVERIETNLTNPSSALPDDVRSTRAEPHPFLSDPAVRKALSIAIDRQALVDWGYGAAGRATCNLVPAPAMFASDNTECLTQDIDGAKALLDGAGYTDTDGDGIRDKDGVPLTVLFQAPTNAVRQGFQDLIKYWWEDIGVSTELRNISPAIYFGGDPASPDTLQKFYADFEMHAADFAGTDPQPYLTRYRCGTEPKPETQWLGENINRYCDPTYDALLDKLDGTASLEERGRIVKELNDMLTKHGNVVIPLVDRGWVAAHANSLGGVVMNTWDSELWNVADWYRIK